MIIQLFNFVRKLATCAITGTRWQIHMAIEHALHYWTVSCPGPPPQSEICFHCLATAYIARVQPRYIYHILDGGLNTSRKNNSKCTRPQPPPARDGKLKSLYLRPSTAIYACRACTCYIYIYIYIHMYRGKERERESEWMSSMVRQIEAATQSLCQSGSTFAASCPSRSTVRRLHPGTSNSLRSSWEVFRERSDPSRLLPGHPRIPQLHLEAN